jgi:hypothetical protein
MKQCVITHLDFAGVDNRRVPCCGIGACEMGVEKWLKDNLR